MPFFRTPFPSSVSFLSRSLNRAQRFARTSAKAKTNATSTSTASTSSASTAPPSDGPVLNNAGGKLSSASKIILGLGAITIPAALYMTYVNHQRRKMLEARRPSLWDPFGLFGGSGQSGSNGDNNQFFKFSDKDFVTGDADTPENKGTLTKDGWRVLKDGDGVKEMEFDDGKGNKRYFFSKSWGTTIGPDGKRHSWGSSGVDSLKGGADDLLGGDPMKMIEDHMKQIDRMFSGIFGGSLFGGDRPFGGFGGGGGFPFAGGPGPFRGGFPGGDALPPLAPQGNGKGPIRID